MKIINSLTKTALVILSLSVSIGFTHVKKISNMNRSNIDDTRLAFPHTLTIVKLKKPSFTRDFIIQKMTAQIPGFQKLPGLQQKFFLFTEDQKMVGGIYFWQDEKDASGFFTPTWLELITKAHGEKGIVDYYSIESLNSFADVPSRDGEYWAVLTHGGSNLDISVSTEGILKEAVLKDSKSQKFYLTVWNNKTSLEKFFKDKTLKNEYFGTPIYLNNVK